MSTHLTVGEAAERYSIPQWKIRRAVDGLGVALPRAGLYRLIPLSLIPSLEAELARRAWLRPEEAVPA